MFKELPLGSFDGPVTLKKLSSLSELEHFTSHTIPGEPQRILVL